MDAVELARQIASELHFTLVQQGNDPRQPYEFALSEATRRAIDVEVAAEGASILNGARAAYIPNDCLIIHEQGGSAFDRAFLVAHEIGHAELGDDEGITQYSIDPTRPAEPSPVGFDRVVDYGRRQRREIQMDLFAREFLLPRNLMRTLYLDQRKTATEIAEEFGAPIEVVAQQLFDALLLPARIREEETEEPPRDLNDEQRSAAEHRGIPYLLEAGPGTGKTQTLIGRVKSLLNEGVDPRRILVLTFSNKAAGEMLDRLVIEHKEAAAAMWIGTFHAFGLDLIRRFHKELDLPKEPRLMDRTEAVELLEERFPALALTHYRKTNDPTQVIVELLSAISRAKDEVVDAGEYRRLAEAMAQAATTEDAKVEAEKALEVATVYEAYERLKHEANCLDFGDLVVLPLKLLDGNPDIRLHLQGTYDHLLVDEYQDVNRSSVRLLKAIRPDGENLWAVGDAKQSIYRFRGASSFNMTGFLTHDFPLGKRHSLRLNYRSSQEIVEAFSHFAREMKVGGPEAALDSHKGPSGSQPELRTVDQPRLVVPALAEAIEEKKATGVEYRDQAVLCPGNERLSSIGQNLERLGIPILFLGSLFERPEVKDLLALLSLLVDRRATGLLRIGSWPEFSMTLADVDAIISACRLKEKEGQQQQSIGWLWSNDITNISEQARAALKNLRGSLEGMSASSKPWQTLVTILLDRTRVLARLAESNDLIDRSRGLAIWQFLNFVRAQPAGPGIPILRLQTRIRNLVRLADERELRQLPAAAQSINAVRLMTIHGAKGLEFDVVHLPGFNQQTMPRAGQPPKCLPPDGMVEGATGSTLLEFKLGHEEEQECLFYVALSRAKQRLLLFASTRKINGHRWSVSPYAERIGVGLVTREVTPTLELPHGEAELPIEIAFPDPLLLRESQLSQYGSCPRRFFYTHILGVGGRRLSTSLAEMHEVVRTLVWGVLSGKQPITDDDELRLRLREAFVQNGLAEHGYALEFEASAFRLVNYFLSTQSAQEELKLPDEIVLEVNGDQVIVSPDQIFVSEEGERVLRRFRTGHKRYDEGKDLAAAAYVLAAAENLGGARIEFINLADEVELDIPYKEKDPRSRREAIGEVLGKVRAGEFPANPSSRTCPRCPAFFICGSVPPGLLDSASVKVPGT